MHWSNFFTIVVAAGVGVLTAFLTWLGTRWTVKHTIADARLARTEDRSLEHARWMRERRMSVYVNIIEARRTRQSERQATLAKPHLVLTVKHPKPNDKLQSQLELFGSDEAVRLYKDALTADRFAVDEHSKWDTENNRVLSTPRSVAPFKAAVRKAMEEADRADDLLVQHLREEIQRPIAIATMLSVRNDSGRHLA